MKTGEASRCCMDFLHTHIYVYVYLNKEAQNKGNTVMESERE